MFKKYEAPANNDGDRFTPKDNIGHVLIVKAKEIETGIVTENAPDGISAVRADLFDLDGDGLYTDALLFGGAFVDGLRAYVGEMVVIKIESRKSKGGKSYALPGEASGDDIARAEERFKQGDPFAPKLTTVSSGGSDDNPPF